MNVELNDRKHMASVVTSVGSVIKGVISVIKKCAKCLINSVIFPVITWTRKNHPGPYQASSWFPGHVM